MVYKRAKMLNSIARVFLVSVFEVTIWRRFRMWVYFVSFFWSASLDEYSSPTAHFGSGVVKTDSPVLTEAGINNLTKKFKEENSDYRNRNLVLISLQFLGK